MVIISSSFGKIIETTNGNWIDHLTVTPASYLTPGSGIYISSNQDVHIWSVAISGMRTNIWIENSSDIYITGIHLSNNGWPNTPGNSVPDPNIYIANSNNILIRWGQIIGQNNWPFGDGEVACYFSDNVTISGTQLFFSGTSAIYFVDCDNSLVENTNIQFAGGWGLDIVNGSDNFTAINNHVKHSRLGGSIFQQNKLLDDKQTGGIYQQNTFQYNNTSGYANCPGINISGDPSLMFISGNTSNNGPVTCSW